MNQLTAQCIQQKLKLIKLSHQSGKLMSKLARLTSNLPR